jgi:hypothetical protein
MLTFSNSETNSQKSSGAKNFPIFTQLTRFDSFEPSVVPFQNLIFLVSAA